jgi:ribosomal-protein-alanine N-acetyltransferase
MRISLETPRLKIREICRKDYKPILESMNNSEVARWLEDTPTTREDVLDWITYCKERTLDNPREIYNAGIEIKTEKILIGEIGLNRNTLDFNKKSGEIMYWINPNYQKKGFASEAITSFLNFLYTQVNLNKVFAEIIPENIGSENLIKKFGFQNKYHRGRNNIFVLSQEDYLKSNY